MAQFFGSMLWREIIRLGKSPGPKTVVAPYYTDDSAVRCRSGDTLIVDATEATISGGQTSAVLLLAAATRGAAVYCHAMLHAKLLVTESGIIVSSANFSAASRGLREAGVRLDTHGAGNAVRRYVDELKGEARLLSTNELKRLAAIPVTPRNKLSYRTSLFIAISECLPELENFAFGFSSGTAALATDVVEKSAAKRSIFLPSKWTFFDCDDVEGVLEQLVRACRGRLYVNFPVRTGKDGNILQFKPNELGARSFEDAHRLHGRIVSIFGDPVFGTQFDLKSEREQLARVLTRGIKNAPKGLLRRINNDAGIFTYKDLCRLFRLGREQG